MKKIKRSWSVEEKIAILKDIEKLGVVAGCRKHGIYATTYYEWQERYEKEGSAGLIARYSKKETVELKRLQKENERLKKLLGEKELELSMQRELLKKKIAEWKSAKK